MELVKKLPANAGDRRDVIPFLGLEEPLEEGLATHSSILAWRTPGTEEPGGLQSMRSQSPTQLSDLAHLHTGLEKLQFHTLE